MAEHPNSHEQQDVEAQEVPTPPAEESHQDPEVMAAEAMRQVQEAADRLTMSTRQRQATGMSSPELDGPVISAAPGSDLSMLADVHLAMTVELGRTRMLVDDVLQLQSGAVVELDKAAGDPVDILVNGRPVARGEVLVLDDTFCIRISEILSSGDPTHAEPNVA
ncbi:MAG: flagellar motor switch protein FliN [Phycisphaerales bacterium]|nr:flagellar motor switch protein FliN [Phycisphaerales bacterium]